MDGDINTLILLTYQKYNQPWISLQISSNLFPDRSFSLYLNRSFNAHSYIFGGLKIGSTAILITFSTIDGIISFSISQPVSKQGFVLISISQGTKSSSIMKSQPKISKVCSLLLLLKFLVDFTEMTINYLIDGRISLKKLMFFSELKSQRYF